MDYLFLISIGPVQDFIASARRSRDLWFGSWLLSELSKAAAHQLATSHGVDNLIFPTPGTIQDVEPGSPLNVANKIMAKVEANDADAVQALGAQVEQAVRARLEALRHEIYTRITGRLETEDDARRQVNDMLEIVWAAVPLTDPEQYQNARQRLEGLLAARKGTRDFRPVTWGSNRPKSSLDGQRESVIPETAYPGRDDPQREDKINDLYKNYGAGEAERLSGVDLLKRHGFVTREDGSAEEHFMSTSHVAALPLLKRLAAVPGARDTWNNYLDQLCISAVRPEMVKREKIARKYATHAVIGEYDGSLLFEERLGEFFGSAEQLRKDKDAQENLRKSRQALTCFLKQTVDGQRPIPYYALLHADGDNMGKVIDATETIKGHQELSRALSGFADKVQHIVEVKHAGALIYAGGDDVLALLPLHTVLACARELADCFREDMQKYTAPVDKDNPDLGTISPTLSAGIVVWHRVEPLSDALDMVRRAETQAKSVPGKDALAVTVSKRSGVDRTVVGKWLSDTELDAAFADKWGTLDRRLERFVKLHRNNQFPDGAAYELHNLYLRVGETLPPDALNVEALRILKRKRAQGGKAKIDEPVLQNIEQVLNLTDMTLEQFANEIIIARIFADADRQAHPDTDKQAKEQP